MAKYFADCEAAGVSSQGVMNYLDAVEASGLEHHAVTVLRHGKTALRASFPGHDVMNEAHVMFSVSKSFTSAAAGFAVSEGLLHWDDRVLDVLSEDAPEHPDERLQRVTLHHLLTMGSGLRPESDEFEASYPGNWAREVLACGCDAEPGTKFRYNSHGTYLVSCMVQKVAGMTVRDYLTPRLFAPLGIEPPRWDMSPQGVCCGGWGLFLSCEALSRFGQCLLDGGMWKGRRILPEEWLERATKAQIDNAHRTPAPTVEWAQGYGYQFWRCTQNRYRADGMYGQLLVMDPDRDMVIAVTAHLDDMAAEMALLTDVLAPAADRPAAPEETRRALERRLNTMAGEGETA